MTASSPPSLLSEKPSQVEALGSTPSHLTTFDGVRCLAVMLVLWAHIPRDIGGAWLARLNYVFQPGYLGVDIFFVLSGFLITRILIRASEQRRPIKLFLARRSLRIFPPYFALLAFVAIWWPGEYVWWSVVYLQNFYFAYDHSINPFRHTWSLAVEEHFYLFWPLVVYYAPKRWLGASVFAVMTIAASAAVSLVAFEHPYALDLLYRASFVRMASLGLGAAFAVYEPWVRQPRRNSVGAVALGILGVMLTGQVIWASEKWIPLLKVFGLGLISGSVVLCALILEVRPSNIVAILLRLRPVAYVGRISYGVYLFHFPVYLYLGVFSLQGFSTYNLAMSLAAISLTFLVATLSYELVEKRILSFKSRLR